jgi:hypothetical protein
MDDTKRIGACIGISFLLLAGASRAQAPAGREFQVNTLTERDQREPVVAYAPNGTVSFIWASTLPPREGDDTTRFGIEGRLFSPDEKAGSEITVRQSLGLGAYLPSVAWQKDGRFLVAWNESSPYPNSFSRPFDANARPLGPGLKIEPSTEGLQAVGSLSALPDGAYLATWEAVAWPPLPFSVGVRVRRVDALGRPQGQTIEVARSDSTQTLPGLAVSPNGDVLIVWDFVGDDAEGIGVSGQLLTASLERVGEPFLINTTEANDQYGAKTASLPSGFIVVWQSADQDGSLEGIYGQILGLDGRKIGPEFQVNTFTDSAQRNPDVAADSHGNFIAVWQGFDGRTGFWSVRGRFYRPGGAPAGDEFEINSSPVRSDDAHPRVAFGPDGTFTVVWQDLADSDDIFARRFAASPGDEPCFLTAKRLLCDTGRTGGTAELPIPIKASASEILLTGDVDGDGKQDLCLNRGTAYRCDTDRDGYPETSFRFGSGRSGEVGLLGDVDGDGRAEPCIREGRELRCDTGHDGGRAEWVLASFGAPSDRILLGDLNGDGRDDVCAFRSGRFLCDFNHDGTAEADLAFGLPGDTPLLGDFDGDGLDDPCVFRDGRFLCDTAHDVGEAEGALTFGGPGSIPLLVNLDGI